VRKVIGVVLILTDNFALAKSLRHVSTAVPCLEEDRQTGFPCAARALFFRVRQRRRFQALFQVRPTGVNEESVRGA